MAAHIKWSRLFGIILSLLTPLASLAQLPSSDIKEPKTKLEVFQKQSGRVVIKGYTEIGKVEKKGEYDILESSVEVTAMEFTDITSRKKISGIVIEVTDRRGRIDDIDRAFVDYEEIPDLVVGLDYISKATSDVTNHAQFEATYRTKGDLMVSTFNDEKGKIQAVVRCGILRQASAYIPLDKLGELRKLIEHAKNKLDTTE